MAISLLPPKTWSVPAAGPILVLPCHVGAKATPTHPFAYSHPVFLPLTLCVGDITTPIFWHKLRLHRYRISTFGRDAKDMQGTWHEKPGTRVKGVGRGRNLELLTERMREILKHKFNAHIPLILNAYPNTFRSITFGYVFLTPFQGIEKRG